MKIADFGLARDATIPHRAYSKDIITLWYRPPEILLGSDVYSSAVDICKLRFACTSFDTFLRAGSAGCIFAEMLRISPLFKGDCEISQLFRIFQVLGEFEDTSTKETQFRCSSGTPDEKLWPGVTSLPNYTVDFPQWQPTPSLRQHVHLVDGRAEDILVRCLVYPPDRRLTAQQALQHPYFLQADEPLMAS